MKPRRLRWKYLLLLPALLLALAFLFRGPLIVYLAYWAQDRHYEEVLQRFGKLPVPDLPKEKEELLLAWKEEHALSPVDYITDKFQDHDLVLLGEYHRIRWQVLLVQEAITAAFARGVRNLALEFLNREDQAAIDRLLSNRQNYDSALAMDLFFRCNPAWGYKEYIDILKTAWTLNQSLPEGAPLFRVLGLWVPDKKEEKWADVVFREVIDKGEKALIYCGSRHAFTRFQRMYRSYEGKLEASDARFGQFLFKALGDRVFTIFLHGASPEPEEGPPVYAADGSIDAFLQRLSPDKRRFGIDLSGTPFGELVETSGPRSLGRRSIELQEIWDGYICHGLLSEYRSITMMKGWLHEKNFDQAIDRLLRWRGQSQWAWLARLLGPETMTELLGTDANIEQRYRIFQ